MVKFRAALMSLEIQSEMGKSKLSRQRRPRGRSPQVLGREGPAEVGRPCLCPPLSPVSPAQAGVQLSRKASAV